MLVAVFILCPAWVARRWRRLVFLCSLGCRVALDLWLGSPVLLSARQNATSLQNFAAAMHLMALECAAAQMMAQRDAGMDEQP